MRKGWGQQVTEGTVFEDGFGCISLELSTPEAGNYVCIN